MCLFELDSTNTYSITFLKTLSNLCLNRQQAYASYMPNQTNQCVGLGQICNITDCPQGGRCLGVFSGWTGFHFHCGLSEPNTQMERFGHIPAHAFVLSSHNWAKHMLSLWLCLNTSILLQIEFQICYSPFFCLQLAKSQAFFKNSY